MKDDAKITVDIKGKQVICNGKTLHIAGNSLTLIGTVIRSEGKRIILDGNIIEIDGKQTPCWIFKNCPDDVRFGCPAFPENGYQCMEIIKTKCEGILQDKMIKKLSNCSKCQFVFCGNHSALEKHQMAFNKDGTPIIEE